MAAAVVPILTTILAGLKTVIESIKVLSTSGKENKRVQGEIEGSLGHLKREVEMAEWDMAKYEGADENMTLQMQELLCDIDDFTSDLCIPDKAAAFFNSLLGRDRRPGEIKRIEYFLASIKSIADRQKKFSKQGNDATNLPSAASASTPFAPEDDLDDTFRETKKEFEELLSPAHGGQLRLIAIVGCSGLGKTALARAVYEATPVQPSPSATEIHKATPVPPSPPTAEIHEPVATGEATPVQQFQTTTEIHELITANRATPAQSSPPTRAVYESTHVQFHGGNKTTRVPPSPHTTEIHEVVAAEAVTPPTDENCEPATYNCKAWVEGSHVDAKDLLNKVLIALDPTAARGNDSCEAIHKLLLDKRYLIIIDDLTSSAGQWKDIEQAFPQNCKYSRIIVTTSVHSIARDYSSARYYVYSLQCLDEANSKGLFRKQVFARCSRMDFSYPEKKLSENILAKCGGLPLAVISAGNYLCWKEKNPHLSDDSYKEVCTELDNIVASDKPAFGAMKKMFAQWYNDLTDYDHKMCLLYLSIFPRGHQINTKSFVRRLKAEALVAGDIHNCLENLIDKSMIVPSLTRSSCHVAKRCNVQGMMLEFAIHMSVSRNLVTLIDKGIVRHNKPDKKVVQQKKIRRLTVQSSSSIVQGRDLIPEEIELSTVRSLTIFDPPTETRVDAINFTACRVMRVLDLEGCKGINTAVLHGICELLLLKYLNLRNTDVDKVPAKIENLKQLEMLDIRHTPVAILPVEVIMLPGLVHLFGEFELPPLARRKKRQLTKFLKEKSKLHTLAGIVINKTRGFEIVIEHASRLKKVKICGHQNSTDHTTSTPKRTFGFGACFGFSGESGGNLVAPNGSATSDLTTPRDNLVASRRCVEALVSSLQKRSISLHSVSIDSSGISKAFLACDMKASVVSSIKLRGQLKSLTARTLKSLCNLNKLHLFSTGLSSQILVNALQSLDRLQYLKLSEGEEDLPRAWEGDFSVQSGGFSALRELCFEGPKMYPRLKIAAEAMNILASLQLLCRQSTPTANIENHQSPVDWLRVEGIEHLIYLDEIILHHSADDKTVQAWKEAAREHTNMPCVKKQPKPV